MTSNEGKFSFLLFKIADWSIALVGRMAAFDWIINFFVYKGDLFIGRWITLICPMSDTSLIEGR